MIDIRHYGGPDTVSIRAVGKITADDYDAAIPELERAIEHADGRLNALLHIDNMTGVDLGAMWKDLKFDARHYDDFGRIAVIAEPGLLAAATRLTGAATSAEVRQFGPDEEEAARVWLRDGSAAA